VGLGLIAAAYCGAHFPVAKRFPPALILSRILAIVLVGGFVTAALWLSLRGKSLWKNLSTPRKEFMREWGAQGAAAGTIVGVALLGYWPGLMSGDVFAALYPVNNFVLSEWWSALYSLYLLTLRQIAPGIGLIALVQAAGVTLFVTFACSVPRSYGVNPWVGRVLLALFLLNPTNLAEIFVIHRDPLFSWIHVACALFIPWYRICRRSDPSPSVRLIALYSLTIVVAARLRFDALVVIPVVPFLLVHCCGWNRKAVIRFSLFCALFWAMLFKLFPLLAKVEPIRSEYALTAISNPLSEYIHRGYVTKTEDVAALSRVYHYDQVVARYDRYDIPWFHTGGVKWFYPVKYNSDVYRLYFRLVAAHPTVFLENRMRIFAAMNGLVRIDWAIGVFDGLRASGPGYAKARRDHGLSRKILWPRLHKGLTQFRNRVRVGPSFFTTLFCSNLLPLLLMAFSLLFFRTVPGCAGASIILLSRLVVVFLLAPAAYRQYVLSLYYFGCLIPVALWTEWRLSATKPSFAPIRRLLAWRIPSTAGAQP